MNDVTAISEAIAKLRAGISSRQVAQELNDQISNVELNSHVKEVMRIARSTGASTQNALQQLLANEVAKSETQRQLDAEFAAPRATARLVTWMPVAVLVFAQLLGLPIVSAVLGSSVAQIAVLLGLVLLAFGARWSKRIISSAEPKSSQSWKRLELMALALGAGMSFHRAAEQVGLESELVHSINRERTLSLGTGAPIAELVALRAEQLRMADAHFALLRVREASVKLTIPLGATVLPALILLLVVPMTVGFAAGEQVYQ